MRIIANTTAPPMITAPAPNTASPCSSRNGNESLNPKIRLTAPRPTVIAASAESRIRRMVGGPPGIFIYLSVRAITRRWISFVPS